MERDGPGWGGMRKGSDRDRQGPGRDGAGCTPGTGPGMGTDQPGMDQDGPGSTEINADGRGPTGDWPHVNGDGPGFDGGSARIH